MVHCSHCSFTTAFSDVHEDGVHCPRCLERRSLRRPLEYRPEPSEPPVGPVREAAA